MSKLHWGCVLKLQNQAAKELIILQRGYDKRRGPAGQFGPIPSESFSSREFPHLPGLMPPWIQCIGTVPLRMRFIRLKDAGIRQGMASLLPFFPDGGMPILVGLCFFKSTSTI